MMIAQQDAAVRQQPQLPFKKGRPSLLDLLLHGDPWIVYCEFGDCLVLYLNNQPVYVLEGCGLEQSTFNAILFDLRNRAPR